MTPKTKEEIIKRINHLSNSIYGLECSDDFLFSNLNGNLPLYNDMCDERRELRNQLKDMESVND